jgi:hypothetical protein
LNVELHCGVRLGHGLWLLSMALVLPVPACSGGYPLPPTPCDEWCDATKSGYCEDSYQPATCVAECERTGWDLGVCRLPFEAVISCFRRSAKALPQSCFGLNVPDDCKSEWDALTACASAQSQMR